MILLYRHVRKQAKERKARKEAEQGNIDGANQQSPSQANNANSTHPSQPSPTQTQTQKPTKTTPAHTGPTGWVVWKPRLMLMGALFFPIFLDSLDYTVVATAQTNIASVFNRLDLQSYIGTAYVLTSTVFLPLFASLADIFGRYWAMQISVFFFIVGSAVSTGASDMPTLLVGRGIAGIGAGGLLGIVRIILSDSVSLDDNNVAGAMLMILYSVGYSVGPVLGGVLLKTSWRWVFGINLPVCAASMVVMALLLPKISKGPQPPRRLKYLPPNIAQELRRQTGDGLFDKIVRVDAIGAFLFVASGILLLLGLNWGSTESWSEAKVIVCLVIGAVLLIPFVVWEYLVDHSTDHLVREEAHTHAHNDAEDSYEKGNNGHGNEDYIGLRSRAARITPSWTRTMDPMIPMNMFRSYDVIATDFCVMTSGMIMLAIFYFVATFYVVVSGKDAEHSGVQLLYFAPGAGAGSLIAMRLIKIIRQPKYLVIAATTVLPIGVGLLAQALYTEKQGQIIAFLVLSGVGVGLGFGPLGYQVRFSQPEDRVAIVIASNLFFRNAGGVIGLAQLSAVMYSKVRSYITHQVTSGAISLAQAEQIIQALGSVTTLQGGNNGLPDELKTVITDAFRNGIRWAFFSLLPWLCISWIMSFFLSTISKERLNAKPTTLDHKDPNANANSDADATVNSNLNDSPQRSPGKKEVDQEDGKEGREEVGERS